MSVIQQYQAIQPQNLKQFLSRISTNNQFQTAIKKCKEKINFSFANIENLNPQKVKMLYDAIQNKYQSLAQQKLYEINFQLGTWQENQLRLFTWFLVCYLFLNKKKTNELISSDLQFLNSIFCHKKIQHLEYQIKLLFNKRNAKWKLEESNLFQTIMMQNYQQKKWNIVAKELFIKSHKKFFKTPKQCRQRWLNHIDPSKKKGNWTSEEDLIILKHGITPCRRWTQISKLLNNSRTQNSVKNRFNSLVKCGKKQWNVQTQSQELIKKMIKKIQDQTAQTQNGKLGIQQNLPHNFRQISADKKSQILAKKDQPKQGALEVKQHETLYNCQNVINIKYSQKITSQMAQEYQYENNENIKNMQMQNYDSQQQEWQEQQKNQHQDEDEDQHKNQISQEQFYKVIDVVSFNLRKQQSKNQGIESYLTEFNF